VRSSSSGLCARLRAINQSWILASAEHLYAPLGCVRTTPARASSPRARAINQGMPDAGVQFVFAAIGEVVEGAALLRRGSNVDGTHPPRVFFGVPIAAMLSPAGVAWIEWHVEGDGFLWLLVAPAASHRAARVMAPARRGVMCDVRNGWVRYRTAGLGTPFAAGDRVRLVYVDATRVVSVMWRGASIDLVALPAAHDAAAARFGIELSEDSRVRITGTSVGGARTRAGGEGARRVAAVSAHVGVGVNMLCSQVRCVVCYWFAANALAQCLTCRLV
jgi:hypothetical protein